MGLQPQLQSESHIKPGSRRAAKSLHSDPGPFPRDRSPPLCKKKTLLQQRSASLLDTSSF